MQKAGRSLGRLSHHVVALHSTKGRSQLTTQHPTACCLAAVLMQLVMLMPFLATDWSSRRQRFLQFASKLGPAIAAGAGILGRLPHWLLDALVTLVEPTAEPHTREGMKALMNRSGVRNNMHLAMHEFRWGETFMVVGLIIRWCPS